MFLYFCLIIAEPIWEEKLKSVIVTAGKSAEFKCVARSAVGEQDNPLVQWFRDSKPLNGEAYSPSPEQSAWQITST